jgi:ABC-type sugar transport system substrate-binding protein
MKKLLSLCMALAMLLTVLVPAAVAEEVTFGYNNYRVGAYSLDILQKNFEYAAKAMGFKVMVVNDEAKIDNCPINVDNMIAAEVKAVAFFGLNDNVMVSIAQRCEQAGVYFAFYDHSPSDQLGGMLKNFQ